MALTAAKLQAVVGADTSEFESGMKKSSGLLQSFAGEAGKMGVAAGVANAVTQRAFDLTGRIIGGAISGSIGLANDFNATMSGVAAVSGATGAQLAQLGDMAIQFGADAHLSGVGASDAARSMEELAKGGVSVADIMGGAARGALLLASAGGIDFADAATIAADALNIFGLSGAQIPHVADLFAAAANSSSIEVSDVALAMKQAGTVAAQFGMSIDDTTAAIAAFGAQGLKGSDAGTSMKTMLLSLANPTDKARTLMDQYGLSFFDAQGHMKSFSGIAGELQTKLSGLTDEQRAQVLETIFGTDAIRAAAILYKDGAAGIDEWRAKVGEAGSAERVAATRMDNLAGALENFHGVMETAGIKIGTALTPAIRSVVESATGLLTAALPAITGFAERIGGAVERAIPILGAFGGALVATFRALRSGDFVNIFGPWMAAIDAAFGPDVAGRVTLTVSKLVTDLQLVRDAVVTAGQAFSGEWVSSDTIAAPVRLVGDAFLMLGNVVRALQDPLGTVNDWIGQLAARFPALAGPLGTVQGLIERFGPGVAVAAAGFLALGPALGIAAALLPRLIAPLGAIVSSVRLAASIVPILGAVIGALGLPITLVVAAIGLLAAAWIGNWGGIRDTTMPIIQQIGAFITGSLLPALSQIGTYITTTVVPAFQAGWTAVQGAVSAAMAAIMPVVQQFIGFLQGQLLPGIQGIIAVAVPAFQSMGAATMAAFQAALPGIQAFMSGMQQLGAAVLPIVAQVAGVIVDSLGPAVMAIVAWAQEVIPQFAAAWNNVMSIVGPLVGQLASAIGAALSAIAGFISAHRDQIVGILTAAWGVISNVIGAALSLVSGLISTVLLAISGNWSGAWERLQQTAADVWDHIKAAIGSALDLIKGLVSVGLAAVGDIAAAAWDGIKGVASAAWDALKALVSAALDVVKGYVTDRLNAAKDAAVTAFDNIRGAASAGMDNLKSAVSDGIDSAVGLIGGLPGRMRDAVGDLSRVLYDAGRSLVQGFIDGIRSLINSIPSIPIPNIPNLPGRAAGGPVLPGHLYVVGEHGPELFMSNQAGRILAHGWTASAPAMPTAAPPASLPLSAPARGGSGEIERLARGVRELTTFLKSHQGRDVNINQTITGALPGDVERETARALRRAAVNWGLVG